MNLNKNTLASALPALGKLICRTSPLALCKSIKIEAEDSTLRLSTCGASEGITFELESECSSNGILNTGICPRSKFRFLFLSGKPSDSISKAFPDRRSTAVSSLGKIRA